MWYNWGKRRARNDKHLKRTGLDCGDKLEIEEHDSLKSFLEKYKPEEHNMFFASTKSKRCYSDVDYSKMEEVFVLFIEFSSNNSIWNTKTSKLWRTTRN